MLQEKNISQVIIEQLSNWGVKRIYGYAGDSILEFLGELSRNNNIQFIATKNEEAAALMASAEAKLTGNLAVCMAHAGPGVAHLINGLADAYIDRVPVLAITGQVENEYIGTKEKQYIDQQSLLQGVTSYSVLVASPLSLINTLTQAIKISIIQKTVSHICVPKDFFIQKAPEPARPSEPYVFTTPCSSKEVIDEAILRLNQAQRPVIIAGRGTWNQGKALLSLAEKWGAAIINTLPASGVVPYDFEFALGCIGLAGTEVSKKVLDQADMVLRLGNTWWPEKYVKRDLRLIQFDENPASIGSPVAVEYGVVGQTSCLLKHLLDGVKEVARKEWRDLIKQMKSQWQEKVERETELLAENHIKPPMLMKVLQENIQDDAIITLDTGNHTLWFARDFQPKNQRVLLSGKWRTMGFGLPAANAAALTMSGRQVVCIVGDGCLNMLLAEITTTAFYKLPVTIVLLRNNTLGMEKGRMQVANIPCVGVDLSNPDFTAVAQACGLLGFKVTEPKRLENTIVEALNCGKPSLIEVILQEDIPTGLSM